MTPTGEDPAGLGAGDVVDLPTPAGPGRAVVHARRGGDAGLLVLSHGAGGGTGAPDLLAVTAAALDVGWGVALVDQPWRVAGRRVAPPPPRLDAAWSVMVPALLAGLPPTGSLVLGGRSAGARVACRTAAALGARGVVALAFPLHPPGRPERSRAAELAAGVPVLVVQGERDPFGGPVDVRCEAPPGVQVVAVPGDHSLRRGAAAAAAAVAGWLGGR